MDLKSELRIDAAAWTDKRRDSSVITNKSPFFLHKAATKRRKRSRTVINIKLENVAIAMHCNLRLPNTALVHIRFNCDAHVKV